MANQKINQLRYSGIQPQYFPRLHYFNRMLNTDFFMIRDDVQFVKKHKYPEGHTGPSYQAHTPIKGSGGLHLLNLPVEHAGLNPIYQTKVSHNAPWPGQHLRAIYFAYAKSSSFSVVYPVVEKILSKKHQTLSELNLNTILWPIAMLAGLTTNQDDVINLKTINNFLKQQKLFRLKRIFLASQSQFYKTRKNNPKLTANEKIIGLIKETGAVEDFCGGTAVAAYLDDDLFNHNGIKVVVQDWQVPNYSQRFTKKLGFLPNLSILDLLMNVSADEARSIIKD